MQRLREIAPLFLGCVVAACDAAKPPPPAPPPSATSIPLYVPPAAEGCARTGSLEAIEGDPACVAAPGGDEVAMRDAMKHLAFELTPDSPTVVAGGTMLLRLAITNRAKREVTILLEAQPSGAGAKPDWSRLAGVPEPKPAASAAPPEGWHLVMPVRTLDASERSVDGLPTTPSAGAPAPRFLRVRLRAGGKLTHTFTWWALRIPAPGPITRNDAGQRYVPKTAPVPLPRGEYTVTAELPLQGIAPPESVVSTRLQVEPPGAAP